MNTCCSAWTPEGGCAHWGPETPDPDPYNTERMTDAELAAHRRTYGLERPR